MIPDRYPLTELDGGGQQLVWGTADPDTSYRFAKGLTKDPRFAMMIEATKILSAQA